MVREAGEAGGTTVENSFEGTGTSLVRLTLKDRVAHAKAKNAEKNMKQPWFQSAVIQYLGNKKWRLGLIPIDGSRAQWLEGLPYEEILTRVEALEGRIKRVDHTSKEYRNYD